MGQPSSKETTLTFTSPTGLYPTCPWSEKEAALLIRRRQVNPRYPGSDEQVAQHWEECPICFRHYPSLNVADCCQQRLCTECYLQLSHPRVEKDCPFCTTSNFTVKATTVSPLAMLNQPLMSPNRSRRRATLHANSECNSPVQTAHVDDKYAILQEASRQARIVEIENLSPSLNPTSPSLSHGHRFNVDEMDDFMLSQAIDASLKLTQA